ncbi:MAG: MBL fold metallo-hydrolase [Clostridia bacterium]|nr:MBL fold metallo-hydrolase [Clostridia bacterium]
MAKRTVNVKIKILSLIIATVMFVVALSSCGILEKGMYGTPGYGLEEIDNLVVKFLDVGQGDSILIMTPEKTMLIDAGLDGCGEQVVIECLKDYGITTIDYIIATHPHADHIGGLDEVIRYVDSVGCVYMPEIPEKIVPTSVAYRKFLESVLETDADVISPEPGETFNMDGAVITFMGPVKTFDDLNDLSIVVRLDYGETSFLFTGDCRKGPFKEVMKKGYDVEVDILKAAHHGAFNATDNKVFNAISPEWMIISCGIDNTYGHPHDEVVEMLVDSETDFYRTDYNGTITVTTDGETYEVTAERGKKNVAV